MKYPVYIPWFEPRVRRRWWSDTRRANAIAKEAATESTPGNFIISLSPSHPKNPHNPQHLLFVLGHIRGTVTSLVTTSSTD